MEFKEVKYRNGRNDELREVLEKFIASDIQVAELIGWEDAYKDHKSAYCALRNLSGKLFPKQIKVSTGSGHVFMEKI